MKHPVLFPDAVPFELKYTLCIDVHGVLYETTHDFNTLDELKNHVNFYHFGKSEVPFYYVVRSNVSDEPETGSTIKPEIYTPYLVDYIVHSGSIYEAEDWYNLYDGQRYDDVSRYQIDTNHPFYTSSDNPIDIFEMYLAGIAGKPSWVTKGKQTNF